MRLSLDEIIQKFVLPSHFFHGFTPEDKGAYCVGLSICSIILTFFIRFTICHYS